jgi:hypothetical protein
VRHHEPRPHARSNGWDALVTSGVREAYVHLFQACCPSLVSTSSVNMHMADLINAIVFVVHFGNGVDARFSSVSGASGSKGAIFATMTPSSRSGGREARERWPCNKAETRYQGHWKQNQIKTRMQSIPLGYKAITSGKGCVVSKGTARQVGTVFFAVSVVSDLTFFSRSFNSGSFWDTREWSVKPEYV